MDIIPRKESGANLQEQAKNSKIDDKQRIDFHNQFSHPLSTQLVNP